jgi:hypothetical protein
MTRPLPDAIDPPLARRIVQISSAANAGGVMLCDDAASGACQRSTSRNGISSFGPGVRCEMSAGTGK